MVVSGTEFLILLVRLLVLDFSDFDFPVLDYEDEEEDEEETVKRPLPETPRHRAPGRGRHQITRTG